MTSLFFRLVLSMLLGQQVIICYGQVDTIHKPASANYLILPSAYSVPANQVYLENIGLGYFSADYGISKNLSAKVSFELFNPIFADQAPTLTFSPKISFPLSDNLRLGFSYINIFGFDDGYIGIPHGVVTIGPQNKNISLGYGHAFYNFFSVNTTYDGVTIGGQYQLSDEWSLTTDNWILIGEPSDSFANDFDFFSVGVRRRIKNKFQLDVGLVYFTEEEDLGNNPWPYIKFGAPAHELFRKKKKIKSSKPKIINPIEKGEPPAKAIFVEGLGIGIFYSLNYDTRFTKRPKNDGFGFRAGISYLEVLLVPLQLNYLLGNKHYLELGSGITFASKNLDIGRGAYGNANITPSASIGYRFQPAKSGFMFRINADAFLPFALNDDGVMPWFGLSVGYKL